MNHSTPGLPIHHQHPKSTQTHVHWVGDAIQPSHPLSSPSPPALNLSWHQGLFLWSRAILIQQVSPGGWSRIKFESPSPLQAGSYLVMINFICQLDWASGKPRQILFWVCLCWCVRIRLPVCLSFGTSVFCFWTWTQIGAHIIISPGSQASGLRRELHHHWRPSCITSLITVDLRLQPSS